ncbi:MAG: class I SAM-dependent methyltransferase [Anaerolineales bacterium]
MFGPPQARGYVDRMEPQGAALRVAGWILHLAQPFTEIEAVVNGARVESSPPRPREDVGRALHWIPHAARSGFSFDLEGVRNGDRLEIRGRRGGRVLARIKTALRHDLAGDPTPPEPLVRRVTGGGSAAFFKADGLRCTTDFLDAVEDYEPLTTVRRMLDWGCGCGRLSVHWLRDGGVPEVHGCDIDAEAVAWCRENLRGGTFQAIAPEPPTPYPDGFFDLVIGYSVFTHLGEVAQRRWLAEMRRVLAPGGLFLASVHGRLVAEFASPPLPGRPLRERLGRRLRHLAWLAKGFADAGEDHALDGIAPTGYYRSTFQTRRYTRRAWSRTFEVLKHREGGMASYQDLVILRRRPGC